MTKIYVPWSMLKLCDGAKQYKTIVVKSGKPLLNTDIVDKKRITGCVFLCGMQHFKRILFSLKSQHHATDRITHHVGDRVTHSEDVTTISTKCCEHNCFYFCSFFHLFRRNLPSLFFVMCRCLSSSLLPSYTGLDPLCASSTGRCLLLLCCRRELYCIHEDCAVDTRDATIRLPAPQYILVPMPDVHRISIMSPMHNVQSTTCSTPIAQAPFE